MEREKCRVKENTTIYSRRYFHPEPESRNDETCCEVGFAMSGIPVDMDCAYLASRTVFSASFRSIRALSQS